MIVSAPFDNWWHNAYGLDVKVLSPPHVILALGFTGIQLGAMLLVLSLQNRAATDAGRRASGLLLAYGAAILLQNVSIMGIEQVGFANDAHNALYYKVAAGTLPPPLVGVPPPPPLPWPRTPAAAVYIASSLFLIWILHLLPSP